MLIKPIIVKCPTCEKAYKSSELISGNTFGAVYYSDGYREAPMLPNLPRLSKCLDCSNFFWVDTIKSSIEFIIFLNNEIDLPILDIKDYIFFIKTNSSLDLEKEFYIRLQIRFLYNHQFRYNKPNNFSQNIVDFCTDNLYKLIPFYEKFYINPDERHIAIAEIYRNIGQFELANNFLLEISTPDLIKIKEILLQEINLFNEKVVVI